MRPNMQAVRCIGGPWDGQTRPLENTVVECRSHGMASYYKLQHFRLFGEEEPRLAPRFPRGHGRTASKTPR